LDVNQSFRLPTRFDPNNQSLILKYLQEYRKNLQKKNYLPTPKRPKITRKEIEDQQNKKKYKWNLIYYCIHVYRNKNH
jgi:hypothetical protein